MKTKSGVIQRLPEAELDIMMIIWRLESPARISQIYVEMSKSHPVTKATLHTLLARLDSRGFIKTEYHGSTLIYKAFYTLVSEEEYRAAETVNFLDKIYHGSRKRLVASLIGDESITEKDISELSSILDKAQKRLEKNASAKSEKDNHK
ncbi:Methicillin resistance regulatory protein MecI [bioreactor metagenome]|uniref:Methicillin resistance regulatory protein MecI n=1 Tax=bioreactor metagenome TaxID=1076179 RepID=A0A644Z9B7_9ZZZZ|nr:BlaI/MecI/CopY family transcriptional regulator [Oscillospiraceae bacterium]